MAVLPLSLKLTSCDETFVGGPVECAYQITDANGETVLASTFTAMAADVEEVAKYTVERITETFLVAAKSEMSDDIRSKLDQAISAPGISKTSKNGESK